MNPSVLIIGFLFALTSYCGANRCPAVCVFDDLKCVTRGGHLTYTKVVNGIKGLIAPKDPLFIEIIPGKFELTKYILTNITLRGLKNCKVTLLKLNATASSFKHDIYCPKLVSTFGIQSKEFDSSSFDRKLLVKLTVEKYEITNRGLYGVFVNEKDHQPHFFIQTRTLRTKTNPKGKLQFEIQNLWSKDRIIENEIETYMNKHWEVTEEYLNYPIIVKAMKIFMEGVDVYCRNFFMGEALPQYFTHKITNY